MKKNFLSSLENVLFQLGDEKSEDYYMFRLIYFVAKKMDICSIRNLLIDNGDLVDYINVLTQKEMRNEFVSLHGTYVMEYMFMRLCYMKVPKGYKKEYMQKLKITTKAKK